MTTVAPILRARAPGKLMLLGEHAVLHGRLALVAAVDRWLSVSLAPLPQPVLRISSELGSLELPLAEVTPRSPLAFPLAVVAARKDALPSGLLLRIHSDFPATLGLGSSSAVTAATVAAVRAWLGESLAPGEVFAEGLAAIHAVQGRGSGADLAAAVHGGLLAYRAEPRSFTPLPATFNLLAAYSGGKLPTVELIARVRERRGRHPALVNGVYDLMDASAQTAMAACQRGDHDTLGEMLNYQQGLMESLGLANLSLATLVHRLREAPGVLGSKISGAGLGDCVVAVAVPGTPVPGNWSQPMPFAARGVTVE